jgi:hypothetical protein
MNPPRAAFQQPLYLRTASHANLAEKRSKFPGFEFGWPINVFVPAPFQRDRLSKKTIEKPIGAIVGGNQFIA